MTRLKIHTTLDDQRTLSKCYHRARENTKEVKVPPTALFRILKDHAAMADKFENEIQTPETA